MDNMNIQSKFLTGIISGIVKRTIQKNLGHDIGIHLNNATATRENGLMRLHLDVDADLTDDELKRILSNVM